MMKLFNYISLLALALPHMCANAQSTQRISASAANEYALIYSLPRTVLDITIETEYTEKTPGEFYNYAKLKLGLNDAIKQASKTATVKNVTVSPRGVADPDNRWTVQFKSGYTPYIILAENGCPISVNTTETPLHAQTNALEPINAALTALERPEAEQAITQEMTLSSSLSKKADLAAQRIFELRETRSDLISGQAENTPPDGKSLQLALDNLSAQEAALTAMFAGTEKTYTDVTTLTFEPDDESINDEVLARLSPIDGIVAANDLSGSPIYISVDILEKGELPVNEKGETKTFPKGGFAYNIPGRALITISADGKQLFSKEFQLSQLGVTFGLDPKLFTDKKQPSKLLLNTVTGAINLLGPVEE